MSRFAALVDEAEEDAASQGSAGDGPASSPVERCLVCLFPNPLGVWTCAGCHETLFGLEAAILDHIDPDGSLRTGNARARATAAAAAAAATSSGAPRCLAELRHGAPVVALAVLDSGQLLSGGRDAKLRLWDSQASPGGAPFSPACAPLPCRGEGLAPLPRGGFAAAGGGVRLIEVWEGGLKPRLARTLRGHSNLVLCVAALPGGQLASSGVEKAVWLWDLASGERTGSLDGHTNSVLALTALPGGGLASGGWDHTVRVWDVAARACCFVLLHTHVVHAMAALEGGRLATGCFDRAVHIWNWRTGVKVAVLRGHTDRVLSLAAAKGGVRVVSGSKDGEVRVWDVAARACVAVLGGHIGGVIALAGLPDGRFASGGEDGSIRVWAA